MSSSEYTDLSRCQHFNTSKALETLRSIQMNFPINELTKIQWNILECVADDTKSLPIYQTVTFRLCERVEYCAENGVYLLVTRYIEVNPMQREIVPKKTVRVLPSFYSLQMYLKNHESFLKF
ncbi:unnamed protein product [Caenorhabditis brenneri]